jgi:hypothetical protein
LTFRVLVGESAIGRRSEEQRQPPNDPHFLLLEVQRDTVDQFLRDLAKIIPAGTIETGHQDPHDNFAEASAQGSDDGVFLGEQPGHVAGAPARDQRKKIRFLKTEVAIDLLFDGGDGFFEKLPVVGIGGSNGRLPDPPVVLVSSALIRVGVRVCSSCDIRPSGARSAIVRFLIGSLRRRQLRGGPKNLPL